MRMILLVLHSPEDPQGAELIVVSEAMDSEVGYEITSECGFTYKIFEKRVPDPRNERDADMIEQVPKTMVIVSILEARRVLC